MYLSDLTNGAVYGFTAMGNETASITGLSQPQGLTVDAMGKLFVANTGAGNIQVFERGARAPIATYGDAGDFPVDVTVCPNGAIYAANIGSSTISVYSPISSGVMAKPARILRDRRGSKSFFITCDASGNVFVTLMLSDQSGAVDEYRGGTQAGLRRLPVHLGFPGGITIDAAGNLLISDQEASRVLEYTGKGVATGVSISTGSHGWADIAVSSNHDLVLGANSVEGVADTFPRGRRHSVYLPQGAGTVDGIAYDSSSPRL